MAGEKSVRREATLEEELEGIFRFEAPGSYRHVIYEKVVAALAHAKVCVSACAGMENPAHQIRTLTADSAYLRKYREAYQLLVQRQTTLEEAIERIFEDPGSEMDSSFIYARVQEALAVFRKTSTEEPVR